MSLEICKDSLKAISDTMYVIGGKWKLPIVFALSFGEMRYKDIEEAVEGISPRMLSKELKELEMNKIVNRMEDPNSKYKVLYSLTDHGESLKPVFENLKEWGIFHKKKILHS